MNYFESSPKNHLKLHEKIVPGPVSFNLKTWIKHSNSNNKSTISENMKVERTRHTIGDLFWKDGKDLKISVKTKKTGLKFLLFRADYKKNTKDE